MNHKKPNTVSIRIREDTYAQIAADGVRNGVKSVDVVEAMAAMWMEMTPAERAIRLGARPTVAGQTTDASGRAMGAYLASS